MGLSQDINRRSFLLGISALAAFGPSLFGGSKGGDVIVVRGVRFDDVLRARETAKRIIDGSIARLLGVNRVERAMKKLLPDDRKYSIKIDCISPLAATNAALIEAMLTTVYDRGVQPWDVTLWDARIADVRRAGYRIDTRHGIREIVAVRMTNTAKADAYTGPVFAVEAEEEKLDARLSRYVVEDSPAIINLPALRYHPTGGFSGALASLAFGAINDPGSFQSDLDAFASAIAATWKQMAFAGHILTVMDARSVVFEGGPVGLPGWTSDEDTLIIGFDPVAVDSAALQVIERIRVERGLSSIAESGTVVLKAAENAGVGSATPKITYLNAEQF